MPRKWTVWILVLLMCCPFLFGEGSTQPSKGIPVEKFIPGLPQLLSGKILKGGILLAACLATVAGAIWENQRGNDFYEQYMASTDVDEVIDLRSRAERSFRSRNYYILGMVSVWALHFLDLKFLKNKKGKVKGEVKNSSLSFGIYFSF